MIEITFEIAKELLDYDPKTGVLTWKERGVKWFKKTKTRTAEQNKTVWNSKHAGKPALNCESFSIKKGNKVIHGLHGFFLSQPIKQHRIIWLWMTGKWPEGVIDHQDGNPINNCWNNLRDVSQYKNTLNRKNHVNNVSGYPGVTWHPSTNKWQVHCQIDKKTKYLGLYVDLDEAIAVSKSHRTQQNGYHKNHGRIVE